MNYYIFFIDKTVSVSYRFEFIRADSIRENTNNTIDGSASIDPAGLSMSHKYRSELKKQIKFSPTMIILRVKKTSLDGSITVYDQFGLEPA